MRFIHNRKNWNRMIYRFKMKKQKNEIKRNDDFKAQIKAPKRGDRWIISNPPVLFLSLSLSQTKFIRVFPFTEFSVEVSTADDCLRMITISTREKPAIFFLPFTGKFSFIHRLRNISTSIICEFLWKFTAQKLTCTSPPPSNAKSFSLRKLKFGTHVFSRVD